MTPPRRKRPVPPRDHPNRGNGMTGRPGPYAGNNGGAPLGDPAELALRIAKAAESTVVGGIRTARKIVETSETTVFDAVERGVETAYTVIEEYMSRGRLAAGRHHQRHNGSSPMADKPPYTGGGASPFGPMGPFMEPWIATARMWAEAMSQLAPGGAAGGRNWMDQMMAAAPPWWGPAGALAPRLSYEVSSALPAEISATLDPAAYFGRLTVGALTPAGDATYPPIIDVGITSASGHVCVRVAVPDGQPTGDYSAQIQDDAGAKRGQVDLKLKTPAGAPAGGQ